MRRPPAAAIPMTAPLFLNNEELEPLVAAIALGLELGELAPVSTTLVGFWVSVPGVLDPPVVGEAVGDEPPSVVPDEVMEDGIVGDAEGWLAEPPTGGVAELEGVFEDEDGVKVSCEFVALVAATGVVPFVEATIGFLAGGEEVAACVWVEFAAPLLGEGVAVVAVALVADCADGVSEGFTVALALPWAAPFCTTFAALASGVVAIAGGLAADFADDVSETLAVALGTTDDMIYGRSEGGPAGDRKTS